MEKQHYEPDSQERFKSRFQIGDTGISQDYINDVLITEPEVILEPDHYGGKDRVKARLVDKLRELRTYGEYIVRVVERYNSPKQDFDGNLVEIQDPIRPEDFLNDGNIDRVRDLDRIVMSMKNLGSSPENFDTQVLLDLMYKASLLIYGNKKEEILKKRFNIGH